MLLLELNGNHFYYNRFAGAGVIPAWLEKLNREMHIQQNFCRGMESMSDISGKSSAYLCRTYKRYFNMSPTEYINRIRMQYAASLFVSSDAGVIDIALEVGFENLSHFYKLFKQRYNITPRKYRMIGSLYPESERF